MSPVKAVPLNGERAAVTLSEPARALHHALRSAFIAAKEAATLACFALFLAELARVSWRSFGDSDGLTEMVHLLKSKLEMNISILLVK